MSLWKDITKSVTSSNDMLLFTQNVAADIDRKEIAEQFSVDIPFLKYYFRKKPWLLEIWRAQNLLRRKQDYRQLRTSRTGRDVLVANLRGEVGASITTWVMLRHFIAKANNMRSNDLQQDFGNQELAFVDVLIQKLQDELIAKLAELGDEKIGRTNFYFASRKLCVLGDETRSFTKFIETKQFRRKRNQEIAHREQPEKWFDDRPIHIPYMTLMRCLAMAVRLMKRIDCLVLGPAAPYLWHEARKRRAEIVAPARAQYLLLPHYRLSPEIRVHVVAAEEAEGRQPASSGA